MVDFRVPDDTQEQPAHRALSLAVNGLWALAGAYAARAENDGWVPRHFVESWPGGRAAARRLVDAEIWVPETLQGVPGYRYADWTAQRSAAQLQAERDAARRRMANLRNGQSGSENVRPNVRANTGRTFGRSSGERSPNVRDSLTQSRAGVVGGVSPVGRYAGARDNEPPQPEIPRQEANGRPADRCRDHLAIDGDPGPCRACGDARRAAEDWDTQQQRAAAQQRSQAARQRAADRARAIAECGLCDDDGYAGTALCDHDPAGIERAARGRAAVQAALGRRTDEPP